ncbi:ATP-grasp domain-containing protein [Rhodopirellula sp. JC639]|uniref:arsenate reductase/protein-tyrosine-phosphatase family protein n=1 Tax=Stieleria mannarensis TaxID=2755585 RepID=UPI0016040AFC|nr:ATP-grasp domain-containing protein [Rhodopirellula sp. JC639]
MKTYDGNVLVLGSGSRAFLTVIRSLGRIGLNVHVAMFEPGELALKSRYVSKVHAVPAYRPGDESWVDAMEAILSETPFQLVIPCTDQAVIPLQLHQERLSRLSRLYVLDDAAYEIAFSKIKSGQLADSLGIPQPKSAVLHAGDSHDVIADFSLPMVVKPPSSFSANDLSAKKGVVRCRTRGELATKLQDLDRWGSAIVQENFNGVGVGVEMLVRHGNVLVAFQHVRVHEPLEGGGSSYRRSAPLHPELLAASKSMMKELGYTGVAMVEFKLNLQTTQWVFVEINGRFWGSLPLAIASGVDFPRYLYEMLVHDRQEFSQSYRTPMFCRNVSQDQRWMRSNLTADKNDPVLATRPLRKVAMEPLNLLLLRERWDTLAIDDLRPGITEIKSIFDDAANKAIRVCRRRLDNTLPVKKWRRWRASQKATKATNILFVCKGNICRSPYAEHYARQRLPKTMSVRSCGYYPVSGRSAPELAQKVARQRGIDLSSHRSQVIHTELIREADLIFTFDDQNRETVLTQFPDASDRVFALGNFCTRFPCRVVDPYGGQESGFQAVYDQIVEAIDHLSDVVGGESAVVTPIVTKVRSDAS